MREDEPLDPTSPGPPPNGTAERELAEALGDLRLAPARTPLRQVWYQAGFEAGRRGANRWQAATVAAALGAGFLLVARAPGPATPVVIERVVYVSAGSADLAAGRGEPLPPQTPADARPMAASSSTSFRLRQAVLDDGWAAVSPSRGRQGDAEVPLRAGSAAFGDDVGPQSPSLFRDVRG